MKIIREMSPSTYLLSMSSQGKPAGLPGEAIIMWDWRFTNDSVWSKASQASLHTIGISPGDTVCPQPDGCSQETGPNFHQWLQQDRHLPGMHTKLLLHWNAKVTITETKMSSFWQNFHHWLHWKLSFWQLPMQPVMKISSKWQHFRFSDGDNFF